MTVIKFKKETFAGTLWQYRLPYLFILPFMILFLIFIVIPAVMATCLAFFRYNSIQPPVFIGWDNFRYIFTEDQIFMKHVIPNTFKFALFVGPGGYFLSFFLAWLISLSPRKLKGYLLVSMYTPSITAGVMMSVIWIVLFSADRYGYLNNLLLNLGIIDTAKMWTTDKDYLMNCMIVVALWSNMGVGFLSMYAGIMNVDPTLYEAGRIDGIKSKLQELWYITIPAIFPMALFAAVMQVIGTFKASTIGVALSGTNPTPNYAGQLILNHMDDYGLIRLELGVANALSLVLLMTIYITSKACFNTMSSKDK